MSTLRYSNPFLTTLKTAIHDRCEQIFRKCRRLVKPFRYWNFLSLLRIAHAGLHVQGYLLFCCSNRILGNGLLSLRSIIWLRRQPRTFREGSIQAAWFFFTYCFVGAGFPFYVVRHPVRARSGNPTTGNTTVGGSLSEFLGHRVHPALYWSFFSVYKIVWSSLQAVTFANWLTDPNNKHLLSSKSRASSSSMLLKKCDWLKWIQRERILSLQNLRYQTQLAPIRKELRDPQNRATIRALRIENRWVALGNTGSAIQDVIDEARDMPLLRPVQVVQCFQNFGRYLPLLDEVCISMSLSLPLSALGQLLELSPNLRYIKLDGVALSVHDLQNDLLEFGARLHGVRNFNGGDRSSTNNNLSRLAAATIMDTRTSTGANPSPNSSQSSSSQQQPRTLLRLDTLRLEHCRLENDEPDPQMRTRYSMDLLLAPVLYTALTPPTCLFLQHLTLWVKCQRISVLELAVTLSSNTSLRSLDLHLIRDTSIDIDEEMDEDEEADDWLVLPLAQTLQYSNSTLRVLQMQLSTGLPDGGVSEAALIHMMEKNETLQSVDLWRSDTQHRIRIPEVDFYVRLNKLERQKYRLDSVTRVECANMLIAERRNVAVVHYLLSLNPSLVLLNGREKLI